MRPIGYYEHHQGMGHRHRAIAIAAHAPDRFVLLGSDLAGHTEDIAAIDLPDDRLVPDGAFDGADGGPTRPHALHYAPLDHDGVRARMTTIARWISDARPALIVVDVSVEVAMLARLCATPVAYVRLNGRRDDEPHLEAFRMASALVAPFAQELDDPDTPEWIRRKTIYAPGIVARRGHTTPQPSTVLVVSGRGGSSLSHADLIATARATPDCRWRVIGLTTNGAELPPNLTFAGWVNDAETEIAQAQIVVGAAGDGLVGAVLATRRPFICIPEPRPFDEQKQKAFALQRMGAAIVRETWPDPTQWQSVLDAARALDPKLQAGLDDPHGAERLTHKLIEIADGQK